MNTPAPYQSSASTRQPFAVRWAIMFGTLLVIAGTTFAATAFRVKGDLVGKVTATALAGSQVHLAVDLKGNLSHLGRSTSHFETVADLGASPPTPVSSSVGVLRAANGNRILFTQQWTAEELGPGIYRVLAQVQAAGGTGRFTGATGAGEYNAVVNLNTGAASATVSGTLIR